MSRQLLINLPVNDPPKSKSFFTELGFVLNEELTDENATCFNIDDNIVIALLPADHFKEATHKNEMVDTTKSNEMLLSIGVTSKEEVDALTIKAVAAGGRELSKPTDYGEIFGATFADLDGHQWNIFYMNSTKKSA